MLGFFLKKINNAKETPVDISTINPRINHAKSIIRAQQAKGGLPFDNVLTPKDVQRYISHIPGRDRIFTPDLTMYAFLSQVLSTDQSCQAAVAQVIAHLGDREDEISANTAAYCKARSRLPEEVLPGLARESAEQVVQEPPEQWLWRGRDVKLVDGTCVSMPDMAENQAIYPQSNTQKKGLVFPWRGWWRLLPWRQE
jgi:hypothetical protein